MASKVTLLDPDNTFLGRQDHHRRHANCTDEDSDVRLLPRVTKPVRGTARIQAQAIWLHIPADMVPQTIKTNHWLLPRCIFFI